MRGASHVTKRSDAGNGDVNIKALPGITRLQRHMIHMEGQRSEHLRDRSATSTARTTTAHKPNRPSYGDSLTSAKLDGLSLQSLYMPSGLVFRHVGTA